MILIHLNIFRIIIFWVKFKNNNNNTFDNLTSEQYNQSILELIYIPFLLFIIILEPWNYPLLLEFLEAKDCSSKYKIFKQLVLIFLNDIKICIIFILLIVTLIDTIPTILLVIRSLKKKYYSTEENKLIYSLNYKTDDFRIELSQIYNKNVKKFITFFLFILNILLLTRIFSLFRRTWPLIKQFFKKCKNNFINCFINCIYCKKRKISKNDILTTMPLIIISEI